MKKTVLLILCCLNLLMVSYGQILDCSCEIRYPATPGIRKRIIMDNQSISSYYLLNTISREALFSKESYNHRFQKDSFIIKDAHVYIHKNDTNYEIFNYGGFMHKDTFYYVSLKTIMGTDGYSIMYLIPDTIFNFDNFPIFRYKIHESAVSSPTNHLSDSLIKANGRTIHEWISYYDYNPVLGFIDLKYENKSFPSQLITLTCTKKFIKKTNKILKCPECFNVALLLKKNPTISVW